MTDAKAPKAPKAKKEKKPKASGYDRDLIIQLFDKGMSAGEIAADGRAGIKGISYVYVGRVLWGSENSGGVNADQNKRRKIAEQRRDAAREAREAEKKTAKAEAKK
jgi:hypothetical protein